MVAIQLMTFQIEWGMTGREIVVFSTIRMISFMIVHSFFSIHLVTLTCISMYMVAGTDWPGSLKAWILHNDKPVFVLIDRKRKISSSLEM